MRLHQFLALHKRAHSEGEGALTRAHHAGQNKTLLAGLSKTYEAKAEDGQQLPAETVKLQTRVPVLLRDAVPALVRQVDMQATVDAGNQISFADITVDGQVIAAKVPVETLLFLEKKLSTLVEVIDKLPVLDEAEDWVDAGDGLSWKTKPSEKIRTDKVPHAFVKAAATDKHPAQVETIYLDEVVGTWSTVKFSGALQASRKLELAERVSKLLAAVKIARGEANSTEVTDQSIGQSIFNFLGWAE